MDKTTHPISNQFMWGDGLLITPVVKPGARNVWGYFPASTLPDSTRITVWYELRTGARVVGGSWVDLPAPLEFIPLHVRGGSILPMQTHAQNTVLAYVLQKFQYFLVCTSTICLYSNSPFTNIYNR